MTVNLLSLCKTRKIFFKMKETTNWQTSALALSKHFINTSVSSFPTILNKCLQTLNKNASQACAIRDDSLTSVSKRFCKNQNLVKKLK